MSRTNVLKMLEEMYFYGVGESASQHFATLVVTGATGVTATARDGFASGYSGDLLVLPKYGIGWGNTGPTIAVTPSTGASAVFSAGDAPNQAEKVAVTGAAAIGAWFTVTSGTAGEVFEVYKMPSYGASAEIDWITSVSGNPSPGKRNVYLRGSLNHRKRIFAMDKQLSIGINYTNSASELLKFAGNPFTLIGERQDDDAGITTESVVIFGCFFEWGYPNESIGDSDTELSVDVVYADIAWVDGDVGA